MNLSRNLSLAEAIKSQTATRYGIDNTPNHEQWAKLVVVAKAVFQPVRRFVGGPLAVTSGFRCEELNRRIGGSPTSSHCKGEALDIDAHIWGGVTNREIFEYIREHLKFDQLIWEFGTDKEPAWVHVSYSEGNNRGQVLRAERKNGRTFYSYM